MKVAQSRFTEMSWCLKVTKFISTKEEGAIELTHYPCRRCKKTPDMLKNTRISSYLGTYFDHDRTSLIILQRGGVKWSFCVNTRYINISCPKFTCFSKNSPSHKCSKERSRSRSVDTIGEMCVRHDQSIITHQISFSTVNFRLRCGIIRYSSSVLLIACEAE